MAKIEDAIAACDAIISTGLTFLSSRQENYRGLKNQYWQGLTTHTTPPAHETSGLNPTVPDRFDTHPTDQFEDWIATVPEWQFTALPCSFQVNVYDGPSGKGWVVIAAFTWNGVRWERHINIGPELHNERAWFEVQEDPV